MGRQPSLLRSFGWHGQRVGIIYRKILLAKAKVARRCASIVLTTEGSLLLHSSSYEEHVGGGGRLARYHHALRIPNPIVIISRKNLCR